MAWSPTKAKLNRRRNKQAKIELDLSGHIGGGGSEKKKLPASLLDDDIDLSQRVEKEIAALPKETQKLLEIIRDKHAYSVRERVQAEVELNKDPDTQQLMVNLKYIKGRQSLINLKNKTEAEQAEIMEQLIQEEEARNRQEQAEFKKNREDRKREERDRKQRQAKALRDAKKQAADQRAKDAQALAEIAKHTKAKVEENIEKAKKAEEDHEAFKEEVLATEENDVLRALKEARLDQRDIQTKNSNDD